MSERHFNRIVAAIAAAALVGRVVATLIVAKKIGGDPGYFTGQGRLLAHGHWFVDPYYYIALHVYVRSAAHPPLFSLFFAAITRAGFESDTAYRVAAACLGGVAVGVIGFAGRRVGGARAGVVAAVVAAFYPYFWSTDLLVLSETLVALVTAWIVIMAYRYWERPNVRRAVWVGVAIAAAALTRAEMILLLPLLGLPLVWRGDGGTPARLRRIGALTAATIIPILPWVVYNLERFDEPVLLSTGDGATFVIASCDPVFYGKDIGWWDNGCLPPDVQGDESARDRAFRHLASTYISNHKQQLPLVVAARVGRMWEVFRPVQTAQLDWFEGRGKFAGWSGLLTYLALLPLAIAGAFVVHARGRPLLPLLALVVTATLTAAAFYGAIRYRVAGDVVLILLAAVTIETAARTASIGSAPMRNR
jgi:4-amino-4-deoxy-L-arabinose transferase-like glycosyltransferase